MKTKLIKTFALILSAMYVLVACNTIDNDNVLSFDSQTLIEHNIPAVSAELRIAIHNAGAVSGNIPYNADALMSVRYTAQGAEISASGNNISYRLPAIASVPKVIDGANQTVTLTCDIECYLEPSVRTKYTDYGYFTYPIRIRQYGSYTQYLTADELTSFADKVDINDQYYAKGTVVAVGSVEEDAYPIGKYPVNPQLFYDRGAMPALSDGQCPASLSEKFLTITLDVDGSRVKVLVNDLARDRFLDDLAASLKAGMTVEISLRNARYDATFEGLLDIQSLAVFIVEEP